MLRIAQLFCASSALVKRWRLAWGGDSLMKHVRLDCRFAVAKPPERIAVPPKRTAPRDIPDPPNR